jgi:hypothetical protein
MREDQVQRLWKKFLRLSKKQTGPVAQRALEPFVEQYTKYVFLGGSDGLEIVNLYMNHPHPLSKKKDEVMQRE